MSKKNKDIPVEVQEVPKNYQGQSVTAQALIIAKKEIGYLVPQSKGWLAVLPEGAPQSVKTEDEGYDLLIRAWNLHE